MAAIRSWTLRYFERLLSECSHWRVLLSKNIATAVGANIKQRIIYTVMLIKPSQALRLWKLFYYILLCFMLPTRLAWLSFVKTKAIVLVTIIFIDYLRLLSNWYYNEQHHGFSHQWTAEIFLYSCRTDSLFLLKNDTFLY